MAKTKYIVHMCAYCHKETKMELVGEMQSESADGIASKAWYRCSRCKHSSLIDRAGRTLRQTASQAKLDRDHCIEYASDKTFSIGQTIYHAELDDIGLVTSKLKISNGVHAINVAFEKLGERRLVESFAYSPSDEALS